MSRIPLLDKSALGQTSVFGYFSLAHVWPVSRMANLITCFLEVCVLIMVDLGTRIGISFFFFFSLLEAVQLMPVSGDLDNPITHL